MQAREGDTHTIASNPLPQPHGLRPLHICLFSNANGELLVITTHVSTSPRTHHPPPARTRPQEVWHHPSRAHAALAAAHQEAKDGVGRGRGRGAVGGGSGAGGQQRRDVLLGSGSLPLAKLLARPQVRARVLARVLAQLGLAWDRGPVFWWALAVCCQAW